jgi:hypothetical protein
MAPGVVANSKMSSKKKKESWIEIISTEIKVNED